MRKTASGGKTDSTMSFSSRADCQVVAERLFDDHAAPAGLRRVVLGQAVLGELLGRPAQRSSAGSRGRTRGCLRVPRLLVQVVEGLAQAIERVVVVEPAGTNRMPLASCSQTVSLKGVRAWACTQVLGLGGEVLVRPVPAAEADQGEARRQQAAVGQVIDRRHELLAGQVAGDAEEHQRGGPGDPVQAAVPAVPQRIGVAGAGRRVESCIIRMGLQLLGEAVDGVPGARGARRTGDGCGPDQAWAAPAPAVQLPDAGFLVRQVQAQHRAAQVGQDLRVAGGLGGNQLTEGEGRSGMDRSIADSAVTCR